MSTKRLQWYTVKYLPSTSDLYFISRGLFDYKESMVQYWPELSKEVIAKKTAVTQLS